MYIPFFHNIRQMNAKNYDQQAFVAGILNTQSTLFCSMLKNGTISLFFVFPINKFKISSFSKD